MPSPRLYPALILLACVGALGAALTAQYAFGLRPCQLCLLQRVPFVVAGLLAMAALPPGLSPRLRVMLLFLCAVAFVADSAIAAFHVGVEQHWWGGLPGCTGEGAKQAQSVEDLQALLAGPPPPRCDQIPWSLFGISMAGYNVPFTLALAGFAMWASRRLKAAA